MGFHQMVEVGIRLSHYLQGFKNIQTVVINGFLTPSTISLHPRKLTWMPKMMVWKRWSPLNMAIFGIYESMLDFWGVDFPKHRPFRTPELRPEDICA